jgi:hypothetical protein
MKTPSDLLEKSSVQRWVYDYGTIRATTKFTTEPAKVIAQDRDEADLVTFSQDGELCGPAHELGHRHGAEPPITTAADPPPHESQQSLTLGREPDRLALRARLYTKGGHHSSADDGENRLPTTPRLEVADLELCAGGST